MQSEFEAFLNDVELTAQSQGLLKAEAFFQLYTEAAIDSGDIEDAQYCPAIHDARPAYRIDGYYLNAEQGELGLLICDFRSDRELPNVNASDCETLFVRVLRFFQNSLSTDFINNLDDQSPAFQAAYLINTSLAQIRRVRVVVLTSGRLSVRKALTTTRVEGGIRFTCNVIDFQRYVGIVNSRRGVDPIEIDLTEKPLAPLPCLAASADSGSYLSYLVVVPGAILAEIYGLYGARLLESNVRSFLQAKTKVNKGIQTTLKNEPENFFAYNNGLTATASEVEISHLAGVSQLTRIRDLQIVNGGQTTASILYARDKERNSLDHVFVQMKLSVLNEAASDQLAPNISRFANSQNKISDADFFSSHPFHLQMERMSRRITTPIGEHSTIGTKWFYERARGQFKDAQSYMTSANKRKFETEYPKDQMLVKTDLAKYELSFEQKPHVVSLGSQKCFNSFAELVESRWDPEAKAFGDGYFRDAMARAMTFRWTDKMIGGAAWYQNDRAYKAQTATYTLSLLTHLVESRNKALDYRKIWNRQQLSPGLQRAIEWLAPRVAQFIRKTPDNIRNVGEYCKRPACWKALCSSFADSSDFPEPDDALISVDAAREVVRDDRAVRKIDSGIDSQTTVVSLDAAFWASVRGFVLSRQIGTPTERGVLDVCAAIPHRIPSERQSVVALRVLELARQEGFEH